MQITDEKVKKNFVIRALKQIGTFFIFTMVFAIVFSFYSHEFIKHIVNIFLLKRSMIIFKKSMIP